VQIIGLFPQSLVKKVGLPALSDVRIYCRQTVRQQIEFLRNQVIGNNVKGMMVDLPEQESPSAPWHIWHR